MQIRARRTVSGLRRQFSVAANDVKISQHAPTPSAIAYRAFKRDTAVSTLSTAAANAAATAPTT
jgi:hypothetical protein